MVKISLEETKKNKLFYFVVTGVILRPKDKRCLILKRSVKETAHPGLWGPVGGKLEWGDLNEKDITRWSHHIPNWVGAIEKLLYREVEEECSLEVGDPRYLESVAFVRPDGVPVVMVEFALKYKRGAVKIAPEFDDFAWVNEKEVKNYDTIDGLAANIAKTIKTYQKRTTLK